MVTKAEIRRFAPKARADIVDAIVGGWSFAEKHGITRDRRNMRQFLANIAAETGGFTILEENMRYKTTKRLREVWPSRFRSDAAARPYVNAPVKLAQFVYGGRMGNAKAPSRDGYTYRGGGLLMSTGRTSYRRHGYEKNPNVLRTNAKVAWETAVIEWAQHKKLNEFAAGYDTDAIRRRVNGGLNGIASVRSFLKKAEEIWPDQAGAVVDKKKQVREVQQALIDLGYTEVGIVDGEKGRYTRAAILAFKEDNEMTPDSVIDNELLKALEIAHYRFEPDGRAIRPAADILREVPEAARVHGMKIVGLFWTVMGFIGSVVLGIIEYFQAAREQLEPYRDLAYDLPGWFWLSALTVFSGWLWYTARKAEGESFQAYRSGKRRG